MTTKNRKSYTARDWEDIVKIELTDAVAKKLVGWLERNATAEKASNGIGDLKKKLKNYKDLAARLRLGYTGDPADLDEIQAKCRNFLLNGTTK
jgi:hypothetical protein